MCASIDRAGSKSNLKLQAQSFKGHVTLSRLGTFSSRRSKIHPKLGSPSFLDSVSVSWPLTSPLLIQGRTQEPGQQSWTDPTCRCREVEIEMCRPTGRVYHLGKTRRGPAFGDSEGKQLERDRQTDFGKWEEAYRKREGGWWPLPLAKMCTQVGKELCIPRIHLTTNHRVAEDLLHITAG